MVELKNKYIDSATYVVTFQTNEKIRLKQADAEKAFGLMFSNVQSIQTNVPDDYDPNAPRLIMQVAKKTLTITQVAVQLTLSFKSSSKPLPEQLDIIEKNINSFYLAVKEFINEEFIEHQGFIISLNYKTKQTQQEMSEYLFKQFFRVKPYGEVASTNFRIGFKTSDLLFINFEASAYEIRETKIKHGENKMLRVKDIPITEEGYNLKVDVNNRPMFMADSKSLPYIEAGKSIRKQMRNTIENEIDNFMGFAG
ncbi:MAG: hypothetical protein WA240_06965 [Nitrospirota bacterium]